MSRKLSDLTPEMQVKVGVLFQLAEEAGLDLLCYCTLRTMDEQLALWRIGRETPGRIVTNAWPGRSAHNYGMAVDCVPMIAGKPQWSAKHPLWQVYGDCVRRAGLEWAGDWKRFREYPHAQMPGFDWRAEMERAA